MTKGYIRHTTVVPLGLLTTVLLSGLVLSSSIVSADNDSVVDQINITIPVSCTMTGTGMDSHNAEIQNGIYQNNIGTTTLHAFCNDNEGFAIYAAGYTGNEIGETNSNKLVGTNASSNATIVSGIATTAGSPDISNWAMKLTATQDSGDTTSTNAFTIDSAPNVDLPSEAEQSATQASFSQYHVVPNEYVKVAHKNSMTDMTTTTGGVKLTTTYAAYISKTQPADTYSGQVKYTLVHPASEVPLQPQTATSGCINYFPNGGNVEGTMGCQSISSSNTSKTLLASNFSRTGYGFAGWSDKYDYATNPDANFYGPNETITFAAGQYTSPNNGLSLYAVWVKSQGSLQDTTKVAELCGTGANALTTASTDGTANLDSVSALTDQRDNETYAIARLADGNCWMIENLRLESENTVGNNRFNPSITNQSLAQGYGTSATYGNFSGLADPESTGFTDTYSANSLYSNDGSNDTINIRTSNLPAYRMPRYNNLNTPASSASRPQNPTSNTFTNDNTTVGMYSYGNYYTWHAAIADTTYYSSGDYGTTSLCPTGWRLPQGNTTASGFGKLDVDMGGTGAYQSTAEASNRWRKYPTNLLYSGRFDTSSTYFRGSYSVYWSSTTFDSYYSYGLDLRSYFVSPGIGSSSKVNGYSIRCMVSAGT